jgi:hypothetical protein
MTAEQTELTEKLNCLEFETSQLNQAYQLWRSNVERGTAPDWMAAAIWITYDALITFCLDTVSALALDTSHAGEIDWYARSGETAPALGRALLAEDSVTVLCLGHGQRLQCDDAETDPPVRLSALVDGSLALTPVRQQNQIMGVLATEQTELIEKLNCLEFETSQLNHAYQLWRSNVERGTAPDWMAAAIRITYDALITFWLGTVSALALDTSHAGEIDWYARSGETAPALGRALLAEDSVTVLCLGHGQRLQCDDAETDPPVRLTDPVDGLLALTPVRQQNGISELTLADVPRTFSARHLVHLEPAAPEISGILGEESTTPEPYPESLPMTEPDWSGPEMPVAISPPSTGDAISEQPTIQQGQQEEEAGGELAAIHIPATLANWLQRSSTSRLFRAASVAILMVAGGAIGIYVVASPQRAAPRSDVRLAATGAVAIPTGEKAEFKFDPDPVVARLGSSFVLNAVLSRGSDIASVGVEIDYDANLLQFVGVSEGGFLVKAGQQFVLTHRDDPLAGVLKISAEQSPGNPGISGDGPVFALSFQARKRGKATVSIVPGAHDSQGGRIEMAGSQVSVTVNEIAKTRKTSLEAKR